jgi:hypothetical protein
MRTAANSQYTVKVNGSTYSYHMTARSASIAKWRILRLHPEYTVVIVRNW